MTTAILPPKILLIENDPAAGGLPAEEQDHVFRKHGV
jgi:hypothetical protein